MEEVKGPSLNGGVGRRGQPLLLRCLYCGEDWPDTAEFYRYVQGKRLGRKCRACIADLEVVKTKPRLCPTCLAVRTEQPECHGCAGRISGDMTAAKLAEWGLSRVVQ